MIGLIMFFTGLGMLFIGFPVAFTFGAVSVFFGMAAGIIEAFSDGELLVDGIDNGLMMFAMMPHRIWSIMNNTILMAIPLFILMGLILQKTKLAERLLESMGYLFGEIRGGLAISTVLVGSLLAASTGVVGASVVAMGVISLPVMLKYNYSKGLATGTICAAGTLGQIIPPSIVLIILGDVFNVPVGDLFKAALFPGLVLVAAYTVYILIAAYLNPQIGPAVRIERQEGESKKSQVISALFSIIPPLSLIVVVLGSIFAGIATPTESSAIGCVGAVILALLYRKFSFSMLMESSMETVKITAMVFGILIGATAFSMVFTYTGGDLLIENFMLSLPGDKWGFIIIAMLVIMILGFFIDFVEISYIIVPILVPISDAIGINPIWFAILIAMNLQTSFLTPPFGFSLFYLKGVAPSNIKTTDIYKGVIPFILIQVLVLASIVFYPEWYGTFQY
ncbi:MAG TPA: TRAP transporter large permease subunit [Candidatus Thioglobus sp.]|jgi:tripartite ATP-independent transporter DctM subunit|nr:TRAP transporter large permease subunit [Candidatus Thioglobus sp.]HIL45435.1 TRAP transporter large permease subunit [Candidatus Thioglobus sp.]